MQKYCVNSYTDMLLDHIYVDNLVKTHNFTDTMVFLYKEAVKTMLEGNFILRSCNSNNKFVRTQMIEDGNYVENSWKKFLLTFMTHCLIKFSFQKFLLMCPVTKFYRILSCFFVCW